MGLNSIQYQTEGTCCAQISVVIENNYILDVEFLGGCPGNLAGIRQLIIGMKTDDVIDKLQGIKCAGKSTSCPDQLTKCLLKYKKEQEQKTLK